MGNLWEKNGHQSQQWLLRPVHAGGEEGFRIHYAAKPEFCIGLVEDAAAGNGKPVVLQTVGGADSEADKQVWTIRAVTISLASNSSLCINLHCADEQNGAVVNLWEQNGHFSQIWAGHMLDSPTDPEKWVGEEAVSTPP